MQFYQNDHQIDLLKNLHPWVILNENQILSMEISDYYHYDKKVGYPSYNYEKLVIWFERFKTACEQSNTSHIMMMEDDVWIKKPITVIDEWEMSCHYVSHGNVIPQDVITQIMLFSGKPPKTNYEKAY